jgi:hypothetical protein
MQRQPQPIVDFGLLNRVGCAQRPSVAINLGEFHPCWAGKARARSDQNMRAVGIPDLRLLGYQLRDALLERIGELSDRFDIDQLNECVNA